MRAALTETYRLRPDRRFLMAVATIHHLLTGWPRETAAVEFREEKWHVRYANAEVGALPVLPDFPDLMAVLSDWARRVHTIASPPLAPTDSGPPSTEFDAQINRLAVPELIAALRQMNGHWTAGRRDPALFAPATRGLVLLTAQSLDRLEMGDAVPAQALALLALTKTFTNDNAGREESLLARLMDYTRHARLVASSLPPSDPVRQYVTGDGEGLRATALTEGATAEARYLWLLQLVSQWDEKAVHSLLQTTFQEPAFVLTDLKARLDLNRFESNASLSPEVPEVILGEMAHELGKPVEGWRESLAKMVPAGQASEPLRWFLEPQLSSRMDHFESDVEAAGKKYTGPFLDSQTYRSYFRGFFYSGLYIQGLHYLDNLSSIEAVKDYADQLKGATRGAAADFSRWYLHLTEFKEGKGDPRSLVDDLSGLPSLGMRPLRRSFSELEKRVIVGDPVGLIAAKRLAARMDTRVDNQLFFSNVAYRALRDLVLHETLHRSALETGHLAYHMIWYANFTGDTKRLTELLRSPEVTPEWRVQILGHLEKQEGVRPDRLRAEYRRLIDEKPEAWSTRSKYVDYLERIKDFQTARSVITEWLDRNADSRGFDYIYARTALARIYQREGKYQEGWEAIEPVIESWQGGAMTRAARLLDKLGRPDEAEEMGRRAVSRYPDAARIRTTLAELYWEHGKPGEAAKVLASMPHQLTLSDWMYVVGPRFAAVFKNRPKEAAAAFAPLLALNVNRFHLQGLAAAAAKAGKDDLAFEMVSRLPWQTTEEMVFLTDAYRYLKASKGKEAALDWVRKAVPRGRLNELSLPIFWSGADELLWDLVESPEKGPEPDRVWLMRAAAAARRGPESDPHRDTLLQYYGSPGPRYYHQIGRFLLGLATEREVLAVATDPRRRCEVAFYIGLRAKGEGRYADASDWFRVAIETGQERVAEYTFAYNTITDWQAEGKSLSRLAAERL
jgi:tetratricopeptide (TPR) repeat protein